MHSYPQKPSFAGVGMVWLQWTSSPAYGIWDLFCWGDYIHDSIPESLFNPQVSVCKEFKWTESNRSNVWLAYTSWESSSVSSIFHVPSALFSVIRGVGSLQLNLLWLRVLASGSQSCSPFPALLGPVSALISSLVGVHLLHSPLISTGPKYPFYPFALVGLATPFLQGLLYFPLSSLPLQIPSFTWRPPLIPLSRVLMPQSWLVCLPPFFSFPTFTSSCTGCLPHIRDCTMCWGFKNERNRALPSKSSEIEGARWAGKWSIYEGSATWCVSEKNVGTGDRGTWEGVDLLCLEKGLKRFAQGEHFHSVFVF